MVLPQPTFVAPLHILSQEREAMLQKRPFYLLEMIG
jgi:hypothetical protein